MGFDGKALLIIVCISAALIAQLQCHNQEFQSPRIIDGMKAKRGQFPYLVAIKDQYGVHNCGGAILNERWILTAAHCVYRQPLDNIRIVAGITKLSDKNGQVMEVEKVIVDEDIDDIVWIPDVALVKLKLALKYNEFVQPIEMQLDDVPGSVNVTIAGWGQNDDDDKDSLKFITVETISEQDCKAAHNPIPIYEFNLCSSTYTFKGICFGDSGSPVAYKGKVAGIVNWVVPCAIGAPDVHSRVSSFANWINEQIKNN